MKITITILLFLNSFLIFSQEKINQINAKGERVGIWKKYYANNRIRYQGQFENGKEIGVFKYFSIENSKQPIVIKTFSSNNHKANVKFYNKEAILESDGTMNGKLRIGKWNFYQPDGISLLSVENYINGILEGEVLTYYSNGKITEILHYKSGKLNGVVKQFSKIGSVLNHVNYVDGKLNGLAQYYDENGELIYKGNYKDDVKVGKWEHYKNGKQVKKDKLRQ